jgi:hypothetical protein
MPGINEQDSHAMLDRFAQVGGNFIDTYANDFFFHFCCLVEISSCISRNEANYHFYVYRADIYGTGESEEVGSFPFKLRACLFCLTM